MAAENPRVWHHLRQFIRGLDLLVFPPICLVCDGPFEPHASHRICPTCVKAILTDPHEYCRRCCSTLGPHTQNPDGCPRCVRESFAFDEVFRLGPYEGQLREAILRMKNLTGETLAETLGEIWADREVTRIATLAPNVIVPIPLHWQRRITRGYNQSVAIAESLAKVVRIPCEARWLRRVRPTPRQATQSATARRENIRGAFRTTLLCRVRGMRVLLIDDVLTTGATAHEAARVLKEAGAAQVIVGVLAHR